MLKLVIERGKVVELKSLPSKSIAVDGYVSGPELDADNQRYSFDHHDRCVRLVTKASCEQVLEAIMLGLAPKDMSIFINDVDGDVVMCWWLLNNPSRAFDPKIRQLVADVGGKDSHGPAYTPIDVQQTRVYFEGVMKPLLELRKSGTYGQANLEELLFECNERLEQMLAGTFDYTLQNRDIEYKIVQQGTGWIMVSTKVNAFPRLYSEGHLRVVQFNIQEDGTIAYTVGKKSEFVDKFPVGPHSKKGTILQTLASLEPGWGGGTTIGGAPRLASGERSKMKPLQVFNTIENIVSKL